MLTKPNRVSIMVSMNRLDTAKRAAIVRALVEGCSIRATVRMTGASKNTVVKLLVELGEACSKYQSDTIRGLRSKRVQCDEIWSFVGAKDKNAKTKLASAALGPGWLSTPIQNSSAPGWSESAIQGARRSSYRTSQLGSPIASN